MPKICTGRRAAVFISAVAAVTASVALAAPSQAVSSTLTTVVLRVSNNVISAGPQTLHPGAIAFGIRGTAGRRVLLFRPRAGQSAATLATDLNSFVSTGTPRRVIRDFVPASGADVGRTLYTSVQQGRYFVVVPQLTTLTSSSIFTIVVSGTRSAAALPAPDAVLRTAMTGMAWSTAPRSIVSSGTIRLDNTSESVHELVLAPMRAGVSIAMIRTALRNSARLGAYLGRAAVHIGAIGPGRRASINYDLQPGRYAVLDYWPNFNGTSHADQGMVRAITVR